MRALRDLQHIVTPAALLLLLSHSVLSQSTKLGENCDLTVLGATETKSFLAFERELKNAISSQDAGMVSLLTLYSLRVNDGHGTYYVHDAGSVQRRFQEIFTPAIQDAILKQVPEAMECNAEGVMYGDGAVWIGFDERYGIATVNLPLAVKDYKAPNGTIGFACTEEKHRVIIDAGADGNPRYRAWNKLRSLAEKPDLEIAKGAQMYEGTQTCRYIRWQFANGSTKFVVDQVSPCDADVPKEATGKLTVLQPDKPEVTWWCH